MSVALKKEAEPPKLGRIITKPHFSSVPNSSKIFPKLRIAISLGALFDMRKAAVLLKEKGPENFLHHMKDRCDVPLSKGPAFSFISQLMAFNKSGKDLVGLTILSKPSKETAQRVQFSLAAHNLTAGSPKKIIKSLYKEDASSVFTCEKALDSFDLILSTNMQDVKTALACGLSAAYVDPRYIPQDNGESPFHPAFDLDRCTVFSCGDFKKGEFHIDEPAFSKKNVKGDGDVEGMSKVEAREIALLDIPVQPGPVTPILLKLCVLREIVNQDPALGNLLLSIVTARTNGSLKRVEKALESWGIDPDNFKSTGWESKGDVLEKLKATAFFDDGLGHIKDAQKKSLKTASFFMPWQEEFVHHLAEPYEIPVPFKANSLNRTNRHQRLAALAVA